MGFCGAEAFSGVQNLYAESVLPNSTRSYFINVRPHGVVTAESAPVAQSEPGFYTNERCGLGGP